MTATASTTREFLLISRNHETLTAVRNGWKQFPSYLNFVPTLISRVAFWRAARPKASSPT